VERCLACEADRRELLFEDEDDDEYGAPRRRLGEGGRTIMSASLISFRVTVLTGQA